MSAESRSNDGQVGINLGDPVFRGEYHGRKAHEDDLADVVQRALDVGCTKLMITGSNLKESRHAVDLAEQYRRRGSTSQIHQVADMSQLGIVMQLLESILAQRRTLTVIQAVPIN